MTLMEAKKPRESFSETTNIVLPSHANALGTIFGGTLMSWVDIAAGISATRHARKDVVTVSVDALHFIAPIQVGDIVHIKSIVNFVNNTSMEVGVRVDSEDRKTGITVHNLSAYLTFVALDENKKKIIVPKLNPQTQNEKRRFEEAMKRRSSRIALRKEIKEAQLSI